MIKSNYDLTHSFMSKDVKVIVDQETFTVHLLTVREIFADDGLGACYTLIRSTPEELKKRFHFDADLTSLAFMQIILFNLGQYDTFRPLYDNLLEKLPYILPELKIDLSAKTMKIKNLNITDEIWNYIVYIIKLSCGEKVMIPPTFSSEEAKQAYMAQQEREARIAAIKAKGQTEANKDSLLKALLTIVYVFPSMTFDYLFDQTLAQIHWLQSMAAAAVSYEVNAQAFAAGNVKKDSKLEFFTQRK